MTFEPLFELWTTVVLLAPPAILLIWQLFRSWRPAKGVARGTWRTRVNPIRRLVIVALLAFAAAGPAVPGGMTKVVVSDIDVFLVIDTTTSSNAEDYEDGSTRLDQIKRDAFEVATEYGGARYSVITFDNGSLVRLPLVADPTALQTTLDTLEVELSTYAGGSSISEPLETLLKRLKGSQSDHPERLRLVFYFGDGEQTRDDPPESMSEAAQYIGDGAVFGYGTEEGGPMRPNLDFGADFSDTALDPDAPDAAPAPYLLDTTEPGDPIAISRIDEDALKTIASELGVGYQHRTPDTEPSFPDVEDRMGEEIEVPEVAVAERLYWIPVLAAFALLLWDLVLAGRNVGDLRAARPPKTPRTSREPAAPASSTPPAPKAVP